MNNREKQIENAIANSIEVKRASRPKTLVDLYRFTLKHKLDYNHTYENNYAHIKIPNCESIFIDLNTLTLRHNFMGLKGGSSLDELFEKLRKIIPLTNKLNNIANE